MNQETIEIFEKKMQQNAENALDKNVPIGLKYSTSGALFLVYSLIDSPKKFENLNELMNFVISL